MSPAPQHLMTYAALRDVVSNGDCVAVHARGAYGAALRLGAMGPYGHVGLVRRVQIDGVERVFLIEENPGGGRYTPLRHYQGTRLDVYSPPPGIDGQRASALGVLLLDGLAQYDWRDIARLAQWGAVRALARLFDDALPQPHHTEVTDGTRGVICNAFVTAAYVGAGWAPPGPCAWPSALAKALGQPRVAYRPEPAGTDSPIQQ